MDDDFQQSNSEGVNIYLSVILVFEHLMSHALGVSDHLDVVKLVRGGRQPDVSYPDLSVVAVNEDVVGLQVSVDYRRVV